jgi:uncharacterized membrane protein YeiB
MTRPAFSLPARIAGLDLARAAVMIGMFAIHFNRVEATSAGAANGGSWRNWVGVEGAIASVSVGFVLIAGIALTLSAARRTVSEVRRAQLTRAVVLLPMGLLLQELDLHGPSVILQNLAVLFLLAIPFVGRSDRVLLGSAVLFGLLGTLCFTVVSVEMPEVLLGGATRLFAAPLTTARDMLLLGTYPVVIYLGPYLLGIWLGRRGRLLGSSRRGFTIAAVTGIVVLTIASLAAESALPADMTMLRVITDPDFEGKSPLWLLNAVCWQTLLVTGCLLVAEWVPRLAGPLVAVGRVPLTVYVGHLLVIAIDPAHLRATSLVGAALRALATTLLSVAFGVWWLRRHRRGPVEAFVENPFRLVHRAGSHAIT